MQKQPLSQVVCIDFARRFPGREFESLQRILSESFRPFIIILQPLSARYTPLNDAAFHDFHRDLMPGIKTRQRASHCRKDFGRGFVENIRAVSHN
jgi:hypothetical protein